MASGTVRSRSSRGFEVLCVCEYAVHWMRVFWLWFARYSSRLGLWSVYRLMG